MGENNVIECEVCFDNPPVYIPLINCAHSRTFCEVCIKKWIGEGHLTCPKCRAILRIQDNLVNTNQDHMNIIDASLIQDYHQSTAGRLGHYIFMFYSIGLLVGLIMYPTIKQL